MRSFKSNENIHKKEGGAYYVVSANKASSVKTNLRALNENKFRIFHATTDCRALKQLRHVTTMEHSGYVIVESIISNMKPET